MDSDLISTSKGDVSPLTTSSESETFDTWTVISEKTRDLSSDEIQFAALVAAERSDDEEEVAVDAVHVEVLKPSDDLIETRYNDIDDLSDGISIISDSESAGRMSPHPELLKRLSELNMRFINAEENQPQPSVTEGSTSLNYEACSERSSDTFHRVEPLSESNRRSRRASRQLVESTDFQPSLRCGLRGLFYVGALLAVLAFISKLKYDAWESVLGTKTGFLTQKINELELKNNLMRAEIDILAKQVIYLTTMSENQKYTSSNKPKNNPPPRENKIKVWPGNGNTIDEVEISSKDLKKPFKCEGHNNVDIAGICIEIPISSDNVVDSVGDKVRVVIDDNKHLSNFERVVDRVAKLIENPFNEHTENPTEATLDEVEPSQQPTSDFVPHEHKSDQYENKKQDKRERDHHKKYSSKNDSAESKERERGRRDRSNEDSDAGGERYKKSKDYKKYERRSSMEYENAKREADGQWHEKLMQHRENSRKSNDKHRHDNNWYIERADSREQARVNDQKYRGGGQR